MWDRREFEDRSRRRSWRRRLAAPVSNFGFATTLLVSTVGVVVASKEWVVFHTAVVVSPKASAEYAGKRELEPEEPLEIMFRSAPASDLGIYGRNCIAAIHALYDKDGHPAIIRQIPAADRYSIDVFEVRSGTRQSPSTIRLSCMIDQLAGRVRLVKLP